MRRAVIFAAAIVVYAGNFGLTSASIAQSLGNREDEDAIRTLIVQMTNGFNSHDAKAASSMYTREAWLVTVRGDLMSGQEAIEKGLASIFATRAKNASHRTQSVSIRFMRPDVALAHVNNELSGLVSADGQSLPSHQELSLRVFVKDDGRWRVAAFHNTMIRPFGAPTR